MHVITLHYSFSQTILPEGEIGGQCDDDREYDGGYDIPIGDIDLFCRTSCHCHQEIPERKDQCNSKQCCYGPDILSEFPTTIIDPGHQTQGAKNNHKVDQPQTDPAPADLKDLSVTYCRYYIICKTDDPQ